MSEEKSLSLSATGGGLVEAVHRRYIEKNADTVIQLLEEKQKLEAALKTYSNWVEKIEQGGEEATKALKEYRAERKKMEETDEYVF